LIAKNKVVIDDVLLPKLQSVPVLEALETELPRLDVEGSDDSKIPQ